MTLQDELQNYLQRDERISEKITIRTIRDYLRASQKASRRSQEVEFAKKQEEIILIDFIEEHKLWFQDLDKSQYIGEGAEQKVYFFANTQVIKLNTGIFYEFWADYFESLLLHNFFFEATKYEFVGFIKQDNELKAVVKQAFVQKTAVTDLDKLKAFLESNGFQNTRNNDYYNSELGIILEDLHDENVLNRNGLFVFIDTVFYIDKTS